MRSQAVAATLPIQAQVQPIQNFSPTDQQLLNVPVHQPPTVPVHQANQKAPPQKRKREGWPKEQARLLVTEWKENFSLIESHKSNAALSHIKEVVSRNGPNKTAKQCKDKLRNLKDEYKRCKDSNAQSGAEPRFCQFYEIFDEVLSARDVVNLPFVLEASSGHGHDETEDNSFPPPPPEAFKIDDGKATCSKVVHDDSNDGCALEALDLDDSDDESTKKNIEVEIPKQLKKEKTRKNLPFVKK